MTQRSYCKTCFAVMEFETDELGRVFEVHPARECRPPANYSRGDEVDRGLGGYPRKKRKCEICRSHFYPTPEWESRVACSDICQARWLELYRARRKEA